MHLFYLIESTKLFTHLYSYKICIKCFSNSIRIITKITYNKRLMMDYSFKLYMLNFAKVLIKRLLYHNIKSKQFCLAKQEKPVILHSVFHNMILSRHRNAY